MQNINLHKNKEMRDIREDKEIALLQRFKDTREKSIKCVVGPGRNSSFIATFHIVD